MQTLARGPRVASTDDPIRRSVDIGVPVEPAFAAWTKHIDRWWPTSAPFAPDLMTLWEPPRQLAFRVSVAGAPDSEVVVRFLPTGRSSCRVELEHRGWRAQATVLARRGRELGSALEVSPAPAVACGGGSHAASLPALRLLR